jgi:cob(I)alamin adenosyltransferase
VDELNAAIGLARCQQPAEPMDRILERVQRDLFRLGADLASCDKTHAAQPRIVARHVTLLEKDIDGGEARLAPLKQFILPGGSPLACHLHVARAVCRRAERAVVGLGQTETVPSDTVCYLNRLSDLLFVMARVANLDANLPDVVWTE